MKTKVYFRENVYYDSDDKAIYKNDKKVIELRAKEYEILEFLLANIDHYCSSDVILNHVWGNDADAVGDNHLIADTISRLRADLTKLEIDDLKPKTVIQTQRQIGYIIRSENIHSSSNSVREVFSNSAFNTDVIDYNEGVSVENIFDYTDIICCVCPDILGAMSYKEVDGGIHIDYDFGTIEKNKWPDFISVVFNFYDTINLLNYYNENNSLKLHLLLNNQTLSFKKIQIELQTEPNNVVGKRFVVDVDKDGSVIEMPISEYAKYKRHLSKIYNLCFVICKDFFVKEKGSFEIKHLCFR